MKPMLLQALLVAMSIASPTAVQLSAEPSVVGLWEQSDARGHAWFRFFEKDGLYYGAIARTFPEPGEKSDAICSRCPGDQKNAPILGLVIVNGMQRTGRSYKNGTILDPRDGSVYKASMELSPDGQSLSVRGYIGLPMFGQSQVWRRLPDDTTQPTPSTSGSGRARPDAATRPR